MPHEPCWEEGGAPADQRGNRALRDAYEPGSTSKVMTLAAVINEGASNINATFKVPGSLERGGKVFRDHDAHRAEVLDIHKNAWRRGCLSQKNPVHKILEII